ncbi:unnamed protein product, partial [Urochloa humidicola]
LTAGPPSLAHLSSTSVRAGLGAAGGARARPATQRIRRREEGEGGSAARGDGAPTRGRSGGGGLRPAGTAAVEDQLGARSRRRRPGAGLGAAAGANSSLGALASSPTTTMAASSSAPSPAAVAASSSGEVDLGDGKVELGVALLRSARPPCLPPPLLRPAPSPAAASSPSPFPLPSRAGAVIGRARGPRATCVRCREFFWFV